MKTRAGIVGCAVLITAVLGLFIFAVQTSSGATGPSTVKALESYGKLPLSFIKNQGQVDRKALYYLRGKEGSIYFTADGIVYDLVGKKGALCEKAMPGKSESGAGEWQRLSFSLKPVGTEGKVKVTAQGQLPGRVNYLMGNDPGKWHKDIPLYQSIVYREIYDNIDLKLYGTNNQMEYDFIVYPGGNPKDIALRFEGIKDLRIDEQGDLLIDTQISRLKHLKPCIYQEIEGRRITIRGTYRVARNTVTFVLGKYRPDYPLVIDPLTLSYSTYLGGTADDTGKGIAVDSSGNVYVTGSTYSTNFPTQNAYQATSGGFEDAFVAKLSSSGTSLSYSTYLGGTTSHDTGTSIAVDATGNACVTGSTGSSDFPTQNAYQATSGGGQDGFVAKLSSSGNSLSYSTYLGGADLDLGNGIAVDSSGNAYVTGYTRSSGFPTHSAYQATFGGADDAFIAKLDSTGSLAYSTYLGGAGQDFGNGIAVDASGSAHVTGHTTSSDFPIQNPYQGSIGSSWGNAFITKLNSSGTSLSYSTYLGGSGQDGGNGIAVDSSGNAYVTGDTDSNDFPLQNAFQTSLGGIRIRDAFVAKLNSSGTSLSYSTYLGGTADDTGKGVAVDVSGSAYVTGYTTSSDFPTQSAYQAARGGTQDGFVAKLSSSGTSLSYSTYLGGTGADYGTAIALDATGSAYVTGSTGSTDFPTQSAYQASVGGSGDAFIAKLAAFSPGVLYFPHIASNSMWETEIGILNSSATETVTGTLRPFGDSGAAVSAVLAVTLAPHGRREIVISHEFTSPSSIGYIMFESSGSAVKGYTKFYQADRYRVAIPATKEINSGDIYLTHVTSDPNWWTGVSLLNTSTATRNVAIEFNDGTIINRSVAASEHQKFLVSDLFGGVTPAGIASAVLRNASGVIGLELFSSANQVEGIPLTDDTATRIYYPHITNNTSWWTGIVAYNPSSAPCALLVTPFGADGSAFSPLSQVLNGREKFIGLAGGLGLPQETAWFYIDGTSEITGFELIGLTDWSEVGGFYGVGAEKREGSFAKRERDGGWTNLVLANTEGTQATVTLTAYDDSGAQVTTTTFTLNGHGKEENSPAGFFPGQDLSTVTHFAYSSDKELIGLQLNESPDRTMLDGLPAL